MIEEDIVYNPLLAQTCVIHLFQFQLENMQHRRSPPSLLTACTVTDVGGVTDIEKNQQSIGYAHCQMFAKWGKYL